MTQTDLIYRAFGGLKKELEEDRRLLSFVGAIAKAEEGDVAVVTHNICHVDEAWVAAIERGLEFISGAIGEDRQFIRSEGEVKPIEKVRNVSRESVVHLSRHSDLISREPEENDIVPDKLYTVERLSDYAVYENRFLYALITRIRDFVTYRYDAILRAYKSYRGELKSEKKVDVKGRKFDFTLSLTDVQDDALTSSADSESASYIFRMERILKSVTHFLRTPLMAEVAKADKLKSKLTKTNVLRMDKNFKEAVVLYEYLLAYEGEGFEIEQVVTRLDPVSSEVAEELALAPLLSAFLMFEHGLGIEEALQEEFEREEARREEKRQAELVEKIKALKKRIEQTGLGMEEYMLLLEERNAHLELDSRLLKEAQAEIEEMNRTIAELRARQEELVQQLGELSMQIETLKEEMAAAEERHRQKIEEMRREHAEAEAELKRQSAEALAAAEKQHKEELSRIAAEYSAHLKENREKLAEKAKETALAREELAAAQKDRQSAERETELLEARLLALRREHGLLKAGDDFTTEAGFNALEHEYEVLGKMVREQWEGVKKTLRKEFYGNLRAVVRKKNARKSERYGQLSEGAKARKARAEAAKKERSDEGKNSGGKDGGADQA